MTVKNTNDKMIKHKSKLLQAAAFFASRRGAFMMAMLGMLVQAWHTYYITSHLSLLEGWAKHVQAVMMAVFLSGALLYFTLKASEEMTDQAEKYRKLVMRFALLESCINFWYWGYKLVYIPETPDWMSMVIAIPFSFLLPIILKAYGGEIRIDEPEQDYTPAELETLQNRFVQWLDEAGLIVVKKDQAQQAVEVEGMGADLLTIGSEADTFMSDIVKAVIDQMKELPAPVPPDLEPIKTEILESVHDHNLRAIEAEINRLLPPYPSIDSIVEAVLKRMPQAKAPDVKSLFKDSQSLIMKFAEANGEIKTLPIELGLDPSKILMEKIDKLV